MRTEASSQAGGHSADSRRRERRWFSALARDRGPHSSTGAAGAWRRARPAAACARHECISTSPAATSVRPVSSATATRRLGRWASGARCSSSTANAQALGTEPGLSHIACANGLSNDCQGRCSSSGKHRQPRQIKAAARPEIGDQGPGSALLGPATCHGDPLRQVAVAAARLRQQHQTGPVSAPRPGASSCICAPTIRCRPSRLAAAWARHHARQRGPRR